MSETNVLLNVLDLKTHFFTYQGVILAVDGVSFSVNQSETVGLVGETGCGKSVTTRSILRLVTPPGRIVSGEIMFDGQDILKMSEKTVRKTIRGRGIAMVFQKPMSSLNPVFTIGQQFAGVLRLRKKEKTQQLLNQAQESMSAVALARPHELLKQYPHELSGGMQQRVLIAMALACQSKLLIADEPTTALDVSVQLQILELLSQIQQHTGMSVLMISHDLGVVTNICDRIIVMYAGTVVESAPVSVIIRNPAHPYTSGLINAVPDFAPRGAALGTLSGEVPNLLAPPTGCRFHPRCSQATEICTKERPESVHLGTQHLVACHHAMESAQGTEDAQSSGSHDA